MRVLFADQYSEPGGAQLVLRDIMAEAAARGWHAEFIAPGGGALFEFCGIVGIQTHSLPIGSYTNGAKRLREVLRYAIDMGRAASAIGETVSRSRLDLVFVNGPRILPAATGVPCPVIFHSHSRPDKRYARTIAQWALRVSGATIICSSKFVASTAGRSSSRVIYNGVGDCGYAPDRLRNGSQTVGIIGRIAPEKGHLDFVRAAEIVARSRPGVRFTVHGEPLFSDPSFERQLRAVTPGRTVEFHGWTNNVASVLHETDILVAPSAPVEATPRVIMEAFSAGTPVIAYRSGGIPELIRHGETGLLTDRPEHQSLAQSIECLLSDPGLMQRLARNGRSEWENRFRLDRFQREVCDLIERSVVQRGQAKATATVACENDSA